MSDTTVSMETRDDQGIGSLSIVSSLEFSFQSGIEEAAVGCLGNLNILLPRPQLANDLCTLAATHRVFSPSLNLEILLCMGVVRVDHRDRGAPGRIDELAATRNHRNGPIAFDLAIHKVVQHVYDKDSVPTVIIVNVGSYSSF